MDQVKEFLASEAKSFEITEPNPSIRRKIHGFCEANGLIARTKYSREISARKCFNCHKWNSPPGYVTKVIGMTSKMGRTFSCAWCGENVRYEKDSDEEGVASDEEGYDELISLTDEEDAEAAFLNGEIRLGEWKSTGKMLIMRRNATIPYKKGAWNVSYRRFKGGAQRNRKSRGEGNVGGAVRPSVPPNRGGDE